MKTKLELAENYETLLLTIIESAKNRIKKTKSKSIIEVCKNRIEILLPKLKEVQFVINRLKSRTK